MAVKVGSARIDENGNITGGSAGDQSGKEVSTQNWYKHPKGWRAFRAIDPAKAAKIAACMQAACNNNNIGYDQNQRNSLYTQAAKVGFDVSKVTVKCETDCSALVRVCCEYAGISGLPSGFNTGNMASNLLKTGAFVELKGSKYTDQSTYLGAGDILVTQSRGHTVVVLSNGSKYEGSVAPKEYAPGERTLRNGDEGSDVKIMQQNLITLKYDVGPSGADGDFGSDTEEAVKAFQKDYGLEVDGVYGPKSYSTMQAELDKLNPAPESAPVPPTTVGDLTVKPGSWNVRTGPGTNYSTAGIVSGGEKLQSVDPGNWQPVLYKGEVMWVSKNALE